VFRLCRAYLQCVASKHFKRHLKKIPKSTRKQHVAVAVTVITRSVTADRTSELRLGSITVRHAHTHTSLAFAVAGIIGNNRRKYWRSADPDYIKHISPRERQRVLKYHERNQWAPLGRLGLTETDLYYREKFIPVREKLRAVLKKLESLKRRYKKVCKERDAVLRELQAN